MKTLQEVIEAKIFGYLDKIHNNSRYLDFLFHKRNLLKIDPIEFLMTTTSSEEYTSLYWLVVNQKSPILEIDHTKAQKYYCIYLKIISSQQSQLIKHRISYLNNHKSMELIVKFPSLREELNTSHTNLHNLLGQYFGAKLENIKNKN